MKLAILGAGKIVFDLLSFIGTVPKIELEAIFGRRQSIDKLEKIRSDHKIKKVYTDFEKLLADPEIDTVYIGLPNDLHFDFAKKALNAQKNVIIEKPFVETSEHFEDLKAAAIANHRHLYEAISNQYLDNFRQLKKWLEVIAPIHLAVLNYSQYSSRYDQFKAGNILPAFDINRGGGALLDLNVYNIHLALGLFGFPDKISYQANIKQNVDTSGILVMNYPDLVVSAIAGKDVFSLTNGPSFIEGENGFIQIDSPTSSLTSISLSTGGQRLTYQPKPMHRMFAEFSAFQQAIDEDQWGFMLEQLEHSGQVVKILEELRDSVLSSKKEKVD